MKSLEHVPAERKPLLQFSNQLGTLRLMSPKHGAELTTSIQHVTVADLSKDQLFAYEQVRRWALGGNGKQVLTLGGFAGTGKSTLLSLLAQELAEHEFRVAYCAYTGKAANELRQKLTAVKIHLGAEAYCGTIHGLIYIPLTSATGAIIGWQLREEMPFDIIVIDEASMIDDELFKHLKSYEKPILAVGDHGQLPPIGNSSISLMEKPDIRLERIHRQAAGNPIIMLSAEIRAGMSPAQFKAKDDRVQVYSTKWLNRVLSNTFTDAKPNLDYAVLCYFNRTRVATNQKIRACLGFDSVNPTRGDLVICLKNTRFCGLAVFNGMRGQINRISQADESRYTSLIEFDDDCLELQAMLCRIQFGAERTISSFTEAGATSWHDVGMLLDFGYCLTVHKAQGSQFETAIVIVEQNSYATAEDHRRWLYTAVTRASDKLIVLV